MRLTSKPAAWMLWTCATIFHWRPAQAGKCDPSETSEVQLKDHTTTIKNSYRASINGSSTNGNYSIAVSGNKGTVKQAGKATPVVMKDQIPWGPNLTLYSFIGTTSDEILVGWAYCSGGSLSNLWLEATDGTAGFSNSAVTGTCDIAKDVDTSVDLATTESCITVSRPAPGTIPAIKSPQLTLAAGNDGVGTVVVHDRAYTLLPFAVVDCATCATDGGTFPGGWVEVHAVMEREDDVCFGIFYLGIRCGPDVQLQYLQCFYASDGTAGVDFRADYDLQGVVRGRRVEACSASTTTTTATETATRTSSSSSSASTASTTSVSTTSSLFSRTHGYISRSSSSTSIASTTSGSPAYTSTTASTMTVPETSSVTLTPTTTSTAFPGYGSPTQAPSSSTLSATTATTRTATVSTGAAARPTVPLLALVIGKLVEWMIY